MRMTKESINFIKLKTERIIICRWRQVSQDIRKSATLCNLCKVYLAQHNGKKYAKRRKLIKGYPTDDFCCSYYREAGGLAY